MNSYLVSGYTRLPQVQLSDSDGAMVGGQWNSGELSDCACSTESLSSTPEDVALDFVNRETLLNEIRKEIRTKSNPRLVIDAPAGYGKSRLLEKLCYELTHDGWIWIYIDLRQHDGKAAIRNEIERQASILVQRQSQQVRKASSDVDADLILKKHLNNCEGKLFLAFDSVERADQSILSWLLSFVSNCTQDLAVDEFRVVFAIRYLYSDQTRAGQFDVYRYKRIELSDFDFNAVYDLIEKTIARFGASTRSFGSHTKSHWATEILRISGGHPKSIVELVENELRSNWTIPSRPEEQLVLFQRHVAERIREIGEELDDRVRESLNSVFVFRKFTYNLLEELKLHKMLPDGITSIDLVTHLSRIGLIGATDGSPFYSDKIVRRLFLTRLRLENPIRYAELHRIAQGAYQRLIDQLLGGDWQPKLYTPDKLLEILLRESIYHCIEQSPIATTTRDTIERCLATHSMILVAGHDIVVPESDPRERLIQIIQSDEEILSSLQFRSFDLTRFPTAATVLTASVESVAIHRLRLNGQEVGEFTRILVEAFNKDTLRKMTRTELNVDLQNIVNTNNNVEVQAFDLIQWAHEVDRVEDLVKAATAANPTNRAIQDFAAVIFRSSR